MKGLIYMDTMSIQRILNNLVWILFQTYLKRRRAMIRKTSIVLKWNLAFKDQKFKRENVVSNNFGSKHKE